MSEIAKLEKRIDKRFDDLTALMSQFANDVNARFDQQDARFDQQDARFDQQDACFDQQDAWLLKHDARFDRIEEQLTKLSDQYYHLVSTIDGFIERIIDMKRNCSLETTK